VDSSDSEIYARLNRAKRVWAIAPVNGEASRLRALHAQLARRLEPGDRIVYLGNYLGSGADSASVVDALLHFRGVALARPRAYACDLAYLRGSAEAMWQKLQELQFAPNPREVLPWMLGRGMAAALASYGIDVRQGEAACREGTIAITHWTAGLRGAIDARAGHRTLLSALKRAAFTDDGALLFAHAGIDPAKSLEMQRDAFWWGAPAADLLALERPYAGFKRVVHGHNIGGRDSGRRGVVAADHAILVDGGCGTGGDLVAACIGLDGRLLDQLAA